jgi:DNA repair protein RadC
MNRVEYHVTIKELPADERPRERLEHYGVGALSTAELVAILLNSGYRNVSALQLAQYLLQSNGGLVGLAKAELDALRSEKGVGLAKAARLIAAFELGRRLASADAADRALVTSPEQAAAVIVPKYGDREREHFGLLALDTKNRVIKEVVVSVGTLDGSIAHPREIFRPAILANAAAVILFHNHPSGDPTPSETDVQVTKRLADAGRMMGVEILDHIVVARNRFISLKRQKLI